MKMSYQHCGSQSPRNAKPGCAGSAEDMSAKVGAPVETSLLRKSRDELAFALMPWGLFMPSWTYIRVLPFGSVVTANAARSWMIEGSIAGLICVHVAPASLERQIPRAYDEA